MKSQRSNAMPKIRQCDQCYYINPHNAAACAGCGHVFGMAVKLLTVQICPKCTAVHAPADKCVCCGLDYRTSKRAQDIKYTPCDYTRKQLEKLLKDIRNNERRG